MATYLSQYQMLPYARLAELFSDLFGMSLSQGTLDNILGRASARLVDFERIVRDALIASPVVHFDESGIRVNNQLHWLHVASTKQLTAYLIHPHRGKPAMDEMGVLEPFGGYAVHDHWYSYFRFEDQLHVLYIAHHLRKLIYAHEQHHQSWAEKLIHCLIDVKRETEEARAAGKRGQVKQHKVKNLHEGLVDYKPETLAFVYDLTLPFDNNLAERDVRMVKVKQKISGCFRSVRGASVFARIRGYISTARKQNRNIREELQNVFLSQPFKFRRALITVSSI